MVSQISRVSNMRNKFTKLMICFRKQLVDNLFIMKPDAKMMRLRMYVFNGFELQYVTMPAYGLAMVHSMKNHRMVINYLVFVPYHMSFYKN